MGPVICLKLGDYVFNVKTHGRFGDSKVAGNLFVAETNANQLKDVQFAGRQILMTHVFRQSGRNIWRDTSTATVDLTDDIEQFSLRNTLEHISQSACT